MKQKIICKIKKKMKDQPFFNLYNIKIFNNIYNLYNINTY